LTGCRARVNEAEYIYVLETGDIKNGKGDESTERSAIYRYAQI
jgi:hypothetical protein